MRSIRVIVVAVGVFVGGAGGAVGAGEEPASLEARLAGVVEREHLGQFWGAVVVRVGGADVLRGGYGFEGAGLTPIDPGVSLFDVGSLSKSVTAAAVLKLVEEGAVSLETTLAEVFPDHDAGEFGALTLAELLGHRLGVRGVGLASKAAAAVEPGDWLEDLRDTTEARRPGEFQYANIGYFLAGGVIQVRSGESFEEAVRSRVMAPAGLRHTGFIGDGAVEGGRSTTRVSMQGMSADIFMYAWNWGQRGAAGVVMTADDAARWVEAAWSPGLLNEASRAAMFDPGDAGYGLGWFVETDDDGNVRRIGHGGMTAGYRSETAHYPMAAEGAGATIVVLTNERWDPAELEAKLARMVAPPPAEASKAGVYLFRYELDQGVLEVSEGLSWSVMPEYRGQDENGRPVVDPRPTVVLMDAGASMWPVMVIMDPDEAAALREAALAALAAVMEVARQPGAEDLPWTGGMRLRIDVAGLKLSETNHYQLAPGSGWTVEAGEGVVIAKLVDKETERVLATVRMGGAETMALVEGLVAAE